MKGRQKKEFMRVMICQLKFGAMLNKKGEF